MAKLLTISLVKNNYAITASCYVVATDSYAIAVTLYATILLALLVCNGRNRVIPNLLSVGIVANNTSLALTNIDVCSVNSNSVLAILRTYVAISCE